MSGLTEAEREALQWLAFTLTCGQCGRSFSDRACGPTHAVIAADPRQHRHIAPLVAAAEQRITERVLREVDAGEWFTDADIRAIRAALARTVRASF